MNFPSNTVLGLMDQSVSQVNCKLLHYITFTFKYIHFIEAIFELIMTCLPITCLSILS